MALISQDHSSKTIFRKGFLHGYQGDDEFPRLQDTHHSGRVSRSNTVRPFNASTRSKPHISIEGRSDAQNAGRSGSPNNRQRHRSSNCTQGIPAGLPPGMPGIGEAIDGAMQQAAQAGRQARMDGADMVRCSVPVFRLGNRE
jgi:hypothetical protein